MSRQKMYNPLTNFVRRIIKMGRRLNRDIFLIVLTLIIGALCGYIPTGAKSINLNWPWWLITFSILIYIVVIVGLFTWVFLILKNIQKIDKKDEIENNDIKAKLDAIVDNLKITPEDIENHKPKVTK